MLRAVTAHKTFFAFILTTAIAYVIAAGAAIYALNNSAAPLHGTAAAAILVVQLLLFVLLVLFITWSSRLRKTFAQVGRSEVLRRMPAWVAWRIGVAAGLITTLVLRSHTTDIASYVHDESL